jgi:hypothetical protein
MLLIIILSNASTDITLFPPWGGIRTHKAPNYELELVLSHTALGRQRLNPHSLKLILMMVIVAMVRIQHECNISFLGGSLMRDATTENNASSLPARDA